MPLRLSLLKNRGDGRFVDVTMESGLGEPIQTEAAAWGDYDNDGWVDLFVCGEYLSPGAKASDSKADRRNRCRLYRNLRDGRFADVAESAGVINERCAKGAAWGDYDGDGRLDLFVSNMGQECRLYHNEGSGRFLDAAHEAGITGSSMSFACWFWDYDNDGFLDLYVNDYQAGMAEVVASAPVQIAVGGIGRGSTATWAPLASVTSAEQSVSPAPWCRWAAISVTSITTAFSTSTWAPAGCVTNTSYRISCLKTLMENGSRT